MLNPAIYILTNKPGGTLYIGVTGDLYSRMENHYSNTGSKFTARYKLKKLVYVERFDEIIDAIAREKQLKNWRRNWKIELVESFNPEWDDLAGEIE